MASDAPVGPDDPLHLTFQFKKEWVMKNYKDFIKNLKEEYAKGEELLGDLEFTHKNCTTFLERTATLNFAKDVLGEYPDYREEMKNIKNHKPKKQRTAFGKTLFHIGLDKEKYHKWKELILNKYLNQKNMVTLKKKITMKLKNGDLHIEEVDADASDGVFYSVPPGEDQGMWDKKNKDFKQFWTVPQFIGGSYLKKFEDQKGNWLNVLEMYEATGYPYFRRACECIYGLENNLFLEAFEEYLKPAILNADAKEFCDKFCQIFENLISDTTSGRVQVNVIHENKENLLNHYTAITTKNDTDNMQLQSFSRRYDSMESKSSSVDAIYGSLCDNLDQLVDYVQNQNDIIAEQNAQIDYLTEQLTLHQRGPGDRRHHRRHRYSRDYDYY